jgi:hypothetical protein
MIVGWRRRSWLMLACCARCGKVRSAGVVHIKDEADPPANFLCDDCYATIMGMEDGADVNPRAQ